MTRGAPIRALSDAIRRVEQGERLPTDPWLSVVPQPSPRATAVVAFPGHIVVAADVDERWVRARCPDDDLAAPLNPPFLRALERRSGRRVNCLDMLLLAPPADHLAPSADPLPPDPSRHPSPDPSRHPAPDPSRHLASDPSHANRPEIAHGPAGDLHLSPAEWIDHPRVRRARRYRDDVRVWATDGGVLVLGRGLCGRWEAAIEVDEKRRCAGLGRSLAEAARWLVPDGRRVWAQVPPGNAASVRALLAAGYQPVGSEALLLP